MTMICRRGLKMLNPVFLARTDLTYFVMLYLTNRQMLGESLFLMLVRRILHKPM